MRTPTAAQRLAEFAHELSFRDVPAVVIEKVRAHVLDSLGAQLLGAVQPWNTLVREYAIAESPIGPSTFVGSQGRGRPEWVALANGTSAQGFEVDDYHAAAQVHPGAVAVPTAFAVGEEVGATDEQILTALTLGFEITLRIALAATPGITHGRGIHTQTAVGPFGAAIVASKLRGLDAEQMTNALGIAGSHSGGTLEFSQTGGEVKRLHAGIANMAGVRAASLAVRGLTAPPTILEGRRGFYQAFSDRVDLDALTADLGTRWVVLDAALKRYCANGLIQAPLRAIHDMVAEEGLRPVDVRHIIVGANRFALQLVGAVGPRPRQMQEAQYSTEFSIALAFVRGGNDYVHYAAAEHEGFADATARAVAETVRVELDPEADAAYPQVFSARVTVLTKEGRRLSRYVEAPGSARSPLPFDEVRTKFHRNGSPALEERDLTEMDEIVSGVPIARSWLRLMPLLSSAGRRRHT